MWRSIINKVDDAVIKYFTQPVGEPTVMKRKRNRQSAMPIPNVNRGLPKTERPQGLCVMPIMGDKFQAECEKDDAENLSRQRSAHSSPRR